MHFTECATLLFYPLCDLLYPMISWWDFVSYKTVREWEIIYDVWRLCKYDEFKLPKGSKS